MPHPLHIDSSVQGERSVSRKLTARAREAWRAAHPGGTVTYRDLGTHPVPHLDAATGMARAVAPQLRTPAQAASWALTEALVDEIKQADTILLGLPLYNFGAPSTVKAWVDHLIARGLSLDPETRAASGLVNVMQQLGGSLGLAVLVTVFGTASTNAVPVEA